MQEKKTVKPVLANAIIWASTMIASALLMGHATNSPMMLILLIGGWFTTHQLMSGSKSASAAECAMLRRFLGRSK